MTLVRTLGLWDGLNGQGRDGLKQKYGKTVGSWKVLIWQSAV